MNYLELVNDVLIRLRESEVTGVADNSYSKLIGKFVNDAKRQVEDAYNWNALSETLTVTTTPSLFNYVMTGAGQRFRVLDILCLEKDIFLSFKTTTEMNNFFLNQTPQNSFPQYYNFNGVDTNGDTQVDLYPIPDAVYNINFNIIKPQAALITNTTELKIPSEPVIFLAYAKALAERGEDAGLAGSEAYGLYQQSLADHISIEESRYPGENVWADY